MDCKHAPYNATSIVENPDRIPADCNEILVYELAVGFEISIGGKTTEVIDILRQRGWTLNSLQVTTFDKITHKTIKVRTRDDLGRFSSKIIKKRTGVSTRLECILTRNGQ